jgi:hypothetical protein
MFELSVKSLFVSLDFGSNQLGFTRGTGCDHAHTTFFQILNSSWLKGDPLYCLLIDIKGAFDNLSHASALLSLLKYGLPHNLVNVFRSWYSGLKVRIASGSIIYADEVVVRRRVRQGGGGDIIVVYFQFVSKRLFCSNKNLSDLLSS